MRTHRAASDAGEASQQAARVADITAFFSVDQGETGTRCGVLIEVDRTERIFTNPANERTEAYVTGRFG